ncbi:MAG: hypothetical protein ACFCGT_23775 [Sandaracinaceae bacterium]
MDTTEKLTRAAEALEQQLDDDGLRPDPARADWDEQGRRLDELRARTESIAGTLLPDALAETEAPPDKEALRNRAAVVTMELAAVLQAAQRRDEASRQLLTAAELRPTGQVRQELLGAQNDPEGFTRLTLARWFHRRGDFPTGDQVLKGARKATQDPIIQEAIDASLKAPRPLKGAPPLYTLNGVGTGLYGAYDRWDDGSYIATYCLCFLFIPILPLKAYRVISQGGGSYLFLSREPLSGFAKGARWAVAAVAALVVVGGAGLAFWSSGPARAQRALWSAQRVEAQGDPEAAVQAYQTVIEEHPLSSSAPEAATALTRLLIGGVEGPMTAERVGEAVPVVRRYQALPPIVQGGEAASLLASSLERWIDEVGEGDHHAQRASLRLAVLGADVAQGPDRERLAARASTLHLRLAAADRRDWPLDALHHYVEAGTPDALREAKSIVLELTPSLLADAEPDLARWRAEGAGAGEVEGHLEALRATRDRWETSLERRQALPSGDVGVLALALEREPEDQGVATALAEAHLAAGEPDRAVAVLEGYGSPGLLSSAAQQVLVAAYRNAGRLEAADALLSHRVEARLPAFQSAQWAYGMESNARVDDLLARADRGEFPRLNLRLQSAAEEDVPGIVNTWLREQIEADDLLADLREDYTARSEVVPEVLSLGMIKLQRAREASGDERARLLGEAERMFLAIQEEAQGLPAYHLSLGQVYYRLGRDAEGEAELSRLLQEGNLEVRLQVARVYRELGQKQRARAVATEVYEQAESAPAELAHVRGDAAMTMAVMATRLEEEERWLRRAPQDGPAVQTSLLQVRARRAYRERDLREADRLFAEVAQRYEAEGAASAAGANNAAIALNEGYLCNGDARTLDRGLRLLERALALSPNNSLLVGNAASMAAYRGQIRVLDRHVRTSTLRLDGNEADTLLAFLSTPAEGPSAREVLNRDPAHRRAVELTQQEQVLAPQRPSGWGRQAEWLAEARDAEGLSALLTRLREVGDVDAGDLEEERNRERSAEDIERERVEIDAAVTDAQAVVEAARRTRDADTLAAALHLLSTLQVGKALESRAVDDAEAAVASARAAVSASGAFGPGNLPYALSAQVLLATVAAHPSAAAMLDERRRDLSVVMMLAAIADADPALARPLREDPRLDEAARLRAAVDQAGVTDLALARLAGDAALEAKAAPLREAPWLRQYLEVMAILRPGDPELEARRALL